jgi:hypothetical protein
MFPFLKQSGRPPYPKESCFLAQSPELLKVAGIKVLNF